MPLSRVGSVQRLRPQRIARPAVKGAPRFHSGLLGLLTLTRKPSEQRMESSEHLMLLLARVLSTTTMASLLKARTLPGLKPNHPTQRRRIDNVSQGRLGLTPT